MGKIYHFHADVGTFGDLNCGVVNGHDDSCKKGILTNDNEDTCEKLSSNFPEGKPHRCTHKVSDDALEALNPHLEVDIWPIRVRKPASRSTAAKKKA